MFKIRRDRYLGDFGSRDGTWGGGGAREVMLMRLIKNRLNTIQYNTIYPPTYQPTNLPIKNRSTINIQIINNPASLY
ncbi:hypothetical protein EYC80_004264 [Monilinia laxa]|uniref:Uncharacterized protein n=1 Tax=Monilinia laxa TaxID=61186 RepID=A0A5N6KMU4_MONLA|nr:hypothetical protein EYC80_004264 [Monilinia laxa]